MKYGIVWHAKFNDGSVINQFNDIEQTQENLFKLVLERQDTLSVFCLFNINTKQRYTLHLDTGIISTGDNTAFEIDQCRTKDIKYRLIYFRRVEKEFTFGEDIPEKPTKLTYFLGCQYTDNGVNHKRLIQIYDDGNIVIY